MNITIAPDIHPDMVNPTASVSEEDQVSRLQLFAAHMSSAAILRRR